MLPNVTGPIHSVALLGGFGNLRGQVFPASQRGVPVFRVRIVAGVDVGGGRRVTHVRRVEEGNIVESESQLPHSRTLRAEQGRIALVRIDLVQHNAVTAGGESGNEPLVVNVNLRRKN